MGTPSGAHFDDHLDCVLDVLAYLLQRDVDVLWGIIGHSPAAALLGVRVLVAEDCPPCNHLAVLVFETIAVNTHAAEKVMHQRHTERPTLRVSKSNGELVFLCRAGAKSPEAMMTF